MDIEAMDGPIEAQDHGVCDSCGWTVWAVVDADDDVAMMEIDEYECWCTMTLWQRVRWTWYYVTRTMWRRKEA